MAILTSTQLLAIISPGTYNLPFEFFDYQQLPNRRHYPSIEVSKFQPGAADRTKQKDLKHYGFKVRVFQKIQSDNNEESRNQEQAELQVISLLEAAVLSDERIIFEGKNWDRIRIREQHPYYFKSELTVLIREVDAPSLPLDGILVFDKANSSVDNSPSSNYQYIAVYDTMISDGYREISEYVVGNPRGTLVPINYAGGFSGRFITNVVVTKGDFGATGDKLNHLRDLKANGEKPEIVFIYTNKSDEFPTQATITETGVKVRIDTIDRVYNNADNTIYRIIGRVVEPTTITAV